MMSDHVYKDRILECRGCRKDIHLRDIILISEGDSVKSTDNIFCSNQCKEDFEYNNDIHIECSEYIVRGSDMINEY